MNDFEKQWVGLSSLGHSGGMLRVYPDHLLDFFINYSLEGNRELIIEANGVATEFNELPSFENIKLNIKSIPNGQCIGLTLTDKELAQNFAVMCFDLAERSKRGFSTAEALLIAIECLRDWSDLLKRRRKSGLTRSEVMGLWGEVSTLLALLDATPNFTNQIVIGWRGPHGDQRDIGFNNTRIEVKTQLSTRSIGLHITSLDQLDETGEKLKIILYRITPSVTGLSLIEIIGKIENELRMFTGALSEFERKLALIGFNPETESCAERFGMDDIFIYNINEGFPRLIPGNVPQGIKSAEYEISGAAITPFLVTWAQLIEGINE